MGGGGEGEDVKKREALIYFFQKIIDDTVLYNYTIYLCYTIDTVQMSSSSEAIDTVQMSSSSEASTSTKLLPHWLLIHHIYWFREPRRGFQDNISMTKILDEQLEPKKQKYAGLQLKQHK